MSLRSGVGWEQSVEPCRHGATYTQRSSPTGVTAPAARRHRYRRGVGRGGVGYRRGASTARGSSFLIVACGWVEAAAPCPRRTRPPASAGAAVAVLFSRHAIPCSAAVRRVAAISRRHGGR
eukprot:scaffold29245_cov84-Isochrysis_galbana.AAC.1